MILKGGSVGAGGLGDHLEKEENEAVRVVASEGLLSRDIPGMVAEVRARAVGITKKGAFHIAVSAQPGQKWGPEEKRAALDAVLKEYRAEGVPYFVVGHEKDANSQDRDEHFHVVISRVNTRGRVVSDQYTHMRNEKLARTLEHELGHSLTVGKHNKAVMAALRAEGRGEVADWMVDQSAHLAPLPTAGLSHGEAQQERTTKVKKADVAADALGAFKAADCGAVFRAALAANGYQLARGREDNIMVVDGAGGSHDLTRLLRAALKAEGVKVSAKEVRAQIDAKTADLDRAALPPLSEVVSEARQGDGPPSPDPAAPSAKPSAQIDAEQVLTSLTWDKATFTEADLDRELRQVKDRATRAELRAAILDHPNLKSVSIDTDGNRRMTSLAMCELEAGLLDRIDGLRDRSDLAVGSVIAATELEAFRAEFRERTRSEKTPDGFDLNAEQIDAYHHIVAGKDLAAVTGVAGAGKSTMMEAANRTWTATGKNVVGCALSAVAAARLAETGIHSDTIHSRLMAWDRAEQLAELRQFGSFTPESRAAVLRALDGWIEAAKARGEHTDKIENKREQVETARELSDLNRHTRQWLVGWLDKQIAKDINGKTVIVVDEAGMVNHRLMNRVLAHAHRVGAKVVAIGDAEQVQPIEAGSAFRLMTKLAGSVELTEVIRQKEQWQREATKAFGAGKPEQAAAAVKAYDAHGHIHAGIRGMGDRVVMYAEATKKLGRDLSDSDRTQIDRMATYMEARIEAGALWFRISADGGKPQDHQQYEAFKAAQERRADAVQAIAGDLETAKPWIARYGVPPEGLAADLSFAEGTPREAAAATAADRAEAMGLDALKADVKLSFDARGAARRQLFEDWKADLLEHGLDKTRIILAYTRDDVARLNADARQVMREAGFLSGPDVIIRTAVTAKDSSIEHGTMDVAVGERIMTLANNRKIGVQNGMTGTVTGIGTDEKTGAVILSVKADDGRDIQINTADFSALQGGVASTLHRAQGCTVDRAWLLNHGLIDRHLAYVGCSRHRDWVKTYSAAADATDSGALAQQFSKGRTKDAISDYVDARKLLRQPAEAMASMREVIGQNLSRVNAYGQRLYTAVSNAFTTHKEQAANVARASRQRPVNDAFGLPDALRQFDARPDRFRAAPAVYTALPSVPRLPLAPDSERSQMLLQGDARRDVADRYEAIGGPDELRRSDLRAEGVDPVQAFTDANAAYVKAVEDPSSTFSQRQQLRQAAEQLARDLPADAPPEVWAAASKYEEGPSDGPSASPGFG